MVTNLSCVVQAYQPETAFEIFDRAMSSRDVATGKVRTDGPFNSYTSHGPKSSFSIKNKLPPPPKTSCYLYDIPTTCEINQYLALLNGTAEIVDFTIVKPEATGGPLGAFQL